MWGETRWSMETEENDGLTVNTEMDSSETNESDGRTPATISQSLQNVDRRGGEGAWDEIHSKELYE